MTYDYECSRCGRTFTVEQKITDAPLTSCPKARKGTLNHKGTKPLCGGEVKRLVSASTTFALKGSGWAKDGY